jgi:hypothetical protein
METDEWEGGTRPKWSTCKSHEIHIGAELGWTGGVGLRTSRPPINWARMWQPNLFALKSSSSVFERTDGFRIIGIEWVGEEEGPHADLIPD